MRQSTRQREILKLLESAPAASVDDLCKATGASPATIRRDLNALAKSGQLRRVHGGAEPTFAESRLRGTPFDVFSYTAVRRAERSLPKEYRAAVTSDLATLDPGCYEAVLRRAALPEMVRGYEHIKMAGIDKMREELKRA